MNPKVTVVIPTYNYGRYIHECLQSLAAQRFQQFEVIVIDDCSTDGTAELLQGRMPDSRFRFHRHERNQGASVARNTGVRLASGEYIVFVDADDHLLPEHLERVAEVLDDRPKVGLLCCDCCIMDSAGRILYHGRTWHEIRCSQKRRTVRTGLRSLAEIYLFSHCFTGFTVRRNVYLELEGMDQSIFPLDDYDFMLRMAGSAYGVFYLDEVLALRRDHESNCSGMRQSVKVGQMTLRCLERTLAANPDLRSLGRRVPRRFAEVYEELAISHFYQRQWKRSAMALARSLTLDPLRLPRIGTLFLHGLQHSLPSAGMPASAAGTRA